MTSGASRSVRVPPPSRARLEFLWAWTSAAVMAALLVGTFMASNLADETASQILGPLAIVAAAVTVWLGMAARRHGEERGWIPAAIGAVVGGFFLVMALLAFLFHFVFGWE